MTTNKWIFFDLDGTLINSIPALYTAYTEFLSLFSCKGTNEEFSLINGPCLEEIIDILVQNHSLTEDKSVLFSLYHTKISKAYKNFITPFDDAQSILKYFYDNKYPMALVTSSDKEIAEQFLQTNDWKKFFKTCIFADDVIYAKPNPAIFYTALLRVHALSNHVLVIEDSLNGITSAKKAGLTVIQVVREKKMQSSSADYIIHSLSEIPILVEKIT